MIRYLSRQADNIVISVLPLSSSWKNISVAKYYCKKMLVENCVVITASTFFINVDDEKSVAATVSFFCCSARFQYF